MFQFSRVPLLRLLIPLVLGILVSKQLVFFPALWVKLLGIAILILLLLLGALMLNVQKKSLSFKSRWLFGALTYLALSIAGFVYLQQYQQSTDFSEIDKNAELEWIGQVSAVNTKADGKTNFLVDVQSIKASSSWSAVSFSIFVYPKDQVDTILVGDLISAKGYLNEINQPLNPVEFDYKAFCANRGIYFNTFEEKLLLLKHQKGLTYYATYWRGIVIDWFKEMGIEGDELAVLSALSLGDKSTLSPDLKSDYAAAGAMHILAVSGLHVGIIFLLFNQLFKRFNDSVVQRTIKALLLLLVIWAYAMLTGFSPSVQRASCMFSFIIISSALKRHSNIINSIAGSALLLILINPNLLYELGFQLSYAAVVGIVLIHPAIYPLVGSKFWIIDKAWSLIVVSLAAQLATLPFTIYYFHQFPNWFLLINLLIIPMAFMIVSGALIVAFFWGVFRQDFYLGDILNAILEGLNRVISFSQSLPFAVTENIWLSNFSVGCIFLTLIFLVYFLLEKKPALLMAALSFLLLMFSLETYLDFAQSKKRFIGFYAFDNSPISVVNGLAAEVFVDDSTFYPYQKKVIAAHLYSEGIRKINWRNQSSPLKTAGIIKLGKWKGSTILSAMNWNIIFPIESHLQELDLSEEWVCIFTNENNVDTQFIKTTSAKVVFANTIKTWSPTYALFSNNKAVHFISKKGYYQLNYSD